MNVNVQYANTASISIQIEAGKRDDGFIPRVREAPREGDRGLACPPHRAHQSISALDHNSFSTWRVVSLNLEGS